MALHLSGASHSLGGSDSRISIAEHCCHSNSDRCLIGNRSTHLHSMGRLFVSANLNESNCSVINRNGVTSVISPGTDRHHSVLRRTTKVSRFHCEHNSTVGELTRTRRGLMELHSVLSRLRDEMNPLGTRDRGTRGFVILTNRQGGLRVNV